MVECPLHPLEDVELKLQQEFGTLPSPENKPRFLTTGLFKSQSALSFGPHGEGAPHPPQAEEHSSRFQGDC